MKEPEKNKLPHCDYEGSCKNKAYVEVYPSLMGGKHKGRGWSYLCRKHYYQEQKRYRGKLPTYFLG
jgi:hypothetical protein